MDKPTYQHPCKTCVYLGPFEDSGERHDLYVCRPRPDAQARLVVVRSLDPEDTYGIGESILESHMMLWPGPAEAYRRARDKGLL